jgi:malonate transporter MadL subunit
MVIYGVALLAICLLSGLFLGELLGQLIGVEANVGGVGIAMLLLILLGDWLNRRRPFLPKTREGVLFWSGIYIPIVVAMAARQNVVAAIDGGLAAFLAGALAVVVGLLLVPVISRVGAESATGAGGGPGRDEPPVEGR